MVYDSLKFTLGFFCGILLYYTVFNQLRKFELKRFSLDEIFVRLSDRYGPNIIVYRPETDDDAEYLINLDRDIHYMSDNATLANRLQDQVRVLCAVLVDHRHVNIRVPAINSTWGRRCSELVLFSARNRSAISKFKHYILPMQDIRYTDKHRQRILEVLSTVYTNHSKDFDWLLLATDDVYVIMENLRYFLSEKNTSLPLFFGQFDPLEYFVLRYYRTNQRFSFSVVLSKSTLDIVNSKSEIIMTSCNMSIVTGEMYEDLCLKKFRIKSVNDKDKYGLDRFNVVRPEIWGQHISDRDVQLRDPMTISDFPVSFRYVNPRGMLGMELLTYHLRPFGVLHPHEEVN